MKQKLFTQSQLQSICDALGHTNLGLTGSEIRYFLSICRIADPDPTTTKKYRLFNALAGWQNKNSSPIGINAFIRKSMKPELYIKDPERYDLMRLNLNKALLFSGLSLKANGELVTAKQVNTLSEAQQRATQLRETLITREVHPDILSFCKEELVVDNYFHAVLEAAKSVSDKIRAKTGLTDDGNTLVDRSLSGDPPLLAINSFQTGSEKSEQKGFANLIRGVFSMFRNPTAHEPRAKWEITKEDAIDLLSLLSLIHRKLDNSYMPRRN